MKQTDTLRQKVRRQLLRDLYYGVPLMGDTLEEINDYYGYHMTDGIYNVIMIRLTPKEDCTTPPEEALSALDTAVRDIYSHPVLDEFETMVTDGIFYLFFNFKGDANSLNAELLRQVTYRLVEYLHSIEGFHFVLGDGLPAISIQEAGTCFRSAHKAVDDFSLSPTTNRRYDSASHLFAMTQMLQVLSAPRRSSFAMALDTLRIDLLLQWVDEVFDECEPLLERYPSVLYQLPYRIFDLCLDASSRAIVSREELQRLLLGCRAPIDEVHTYAEAREATKQGLVTFCQRYAAEVPQTGKQTVANIRSYIRAHFTEKLTLDAIAAHIGLTPQYLSVFFKKETGQSIVDLITTMRIDRAKELLRGSQLSIGEIAQAVGYDDPNYFSRTFRRRTALTPREYRNSSNQ